MPVSWRFCWWEIWFQYQGQHASRFFSLLILKTFLLDIWCSISMTSQKSVVSVWSQICLVVYIGGLKRTLTCIISLILLSSEFELLLLYRAFLLFQLLKYNISELRWCGPHPNQLPVKWLQMAEMNSMPSNLLIVRTAKNVGTIFLFLGRIIGGLPWYSFLPQAVLE